MVDEDAITELARLIHAEVERIASDPAAHPRLLDDVFGRATDEERARLAHRVFDALNADRQWDELVRLFGDDDLRRYLADLRDRASATKTIDTREIPRDEVLTLGLCREEDAAVALSRGHRSTVAARRLVLRSLGDGNFQVLSDVFNPDGGYFVTRDYDENTWWQEKLDGHAQVRVGSITDQSFDPVLHPGGRVDLGTKEGDVRGQLCLGFALIGGAGVFSL